jgi:hypothetical protein
MLQVTLLRAVEEASESTHAARFVAKFKGHRADASPLYLGVRLIM